MNRLADALAQIGLCEVLRARLNAAEAGRKPLPDQPGVAVLPTEEDVVATYRRNVLSNLLRLSES